MASLLVSGDKCIGVDFEKEASKDVNFSFFFRIKGFYIDLYIETDVIYKRYPLFFY